ncbi:MAG: hypothetical protein Q9219_006139 [cf. Caloplaca sp. 3 TL-2023]
MEHIYQSSLYGPPELPFRQNDQLIGTVSVFDISDTNKLSPASSISGKICFKDATNILLDLRSPSINTRLRCLFLDLEPSSKMFKHDMTAAVLDAIGLSLKVEPACIEAYLEILDSRHSFSSEARSVLAKPKPKRFPEACYMVINDSVITVSRDYLPYGNNEPPVMLILGRPVEHGYMNRKHTPNYFDPPKEWRPQHRVVKDWFESFESELQSHLKSSKKYVIDESAIICSIILLLLVEILKDMKFAFICQMEEYNWIVRDEKIDRNTRSIGEREEVGREPRLEVLRFGLRRQMSVLEQAMGDFKAFARSHVAARGLLQSPVFQSFKKDVACYMQDAKGLEAEIRDWLQIRVGMLSLEESKKSIELSNLQIGESKRVKIGTDNLGLREKKLESLDGMKIIPIGDYIVKYAYKEQTWWFDHSNLREISPNRRKQPVLRSEKPDSRSKLPPVPPTSTSSASTVRPEESSMSRRQSFGSSTSAERGIRVLSDTAEV